MDVEKVFEPVSITLTALEWLAVHGNVCLGLRHPDNNGPSRDVAENILRIIEDALLTVGLLVPEEIELVHKTEQEAVGRCVNRGSA